MALRVGYGGVKFEGYGNFWSVLHADPWSSIPVADALITGPLDPAAAFSQPPLALCKLLLLRAVKVVTDIGHSDAVTADLDTAWDNAQTRLDLLIAGAQRSSDPAELAAATRLRGALIPPVANTNGVTHLSYAQEVDYGGLQKIQAARPEVHADVVLLGLTSAVSQAGTATEALAQALHTSTATGRKTTVHAEQVAARQGCVHAFTVVHDVLLTLLAITTDGPQRVTAEAVFQTLTDLLQRYPARPVVSAPATTPTHPTATTPTTATGNADVTIIPAGSGTPATPTTPGAAAPQAPVRAPVTAPTSPRRARKAKSPTRAVRVPPAAKRSPTAKKKSPTTVKKITKKKKS